MNKFTILCVLALALMACQDKAPTNLPPLGEASADTIKASPSGGRLEGASSRGRLEGASLGASFSCKGTIESVSEVAVTSRINEQIVMLGVEMGQRVHKGQVVARLDRTATEDKIVKGRAELERAEYQYQNILMGQGYKRGAFDQAPENIREMARVNSGYNTAKAALRQLEHQLTYCTIQAPISGVVTQLDAVLYATAVPGETLFRIVDTDHLKVCFDILENELQRFEKGTAITVTLISYPDDRHQARITAVSPVVEKSGMIHLEATLTPHPHLMPGMSAIVTLGNTDN